AKNLVVVKIGNGIGAGVVLDGRIHSGENDAAGEIGHVVVDPDGPACFCGKAGCLETVAAIPYLIRTLARFTDDSASLPAPDVLGRAAELAEEGNPDVLAVLNEAGRNLAKVLSTTVAILDVHQVIVTGPISRLGEPFLARLRSEIQQRILPTLAAKLELRYGRTGERAVRMGAAAYVVNDQLGVL
ncbi:MAG: ROK family protein, partial [Acidimicrobiia bacterium]